MTAFETDVDDMSEYGATVVDGVVIARTRKVQAEPVTYPAGDIAAFAAKVEAAADDQRALWYET